MTKDPEYPLKKLIMRIARCYLDYFPLDCGIKAIDKIEYARKKGLISSSVITTCRMKYCRMP